jgi:hypothetical protein
MVQVHVHVFIPYCLLIVNAHILVSGMIYLFDVDCTHTHTHNYCTTYAICHYFLVRSQSCMYATLFRHRDDFIIFAEVSICLYESATVAYND